MTIKKSTLWFIVVALVWFNFIAWSYKNSGIPTQPTTPTGCQALRSQILRDQCEAQVHPPIGHPK